MQYILHNILTVVNTFWAKKDTKNFKTKYQTKKNLSENIGKVFRLWVANILMLSNQLNHQFNETVNIKIFA